MFLNDQTILSITHGAISYTRTSSGFSFRKCTQLQIDSFYENRLFPDDPIENDCMFRANAEAEAGIMLDFYTDSPFVTFHIPVFEIFFNFGVGMSLCVDGKFKKEIVQPGFHTVRLRGGKHRVTLVFCYFGRSVLRSVEVADGAAVTPVPKNGLWLFIGDSITHGMVANHSCNTYPDRIALFSDYEIINQGNAGYFFDSNTLDDIGRKPDIITVAYGTNDFGRIDLPAIRRNMIDFCDTLVKLYPASDIYLISPIWRSECKTVKGFSDSFNRLYPMFDEVCAAYPGVTHLDGRKLMPHNTAENRNAFSPDGLHPSDHGFAFYASRLYRSVTDRL